MSGTMKHGMMTRILNKGGLLAFILVIALFSFQPALAQSPDGQVYIVQADDTLWKVAEKYLGDGNLFEVIVAATQDQKLLDASFADVSDPNLIYSGSKLWIPANPALPDAAPAPSSTLTPSTSMPEIAVLPQSSNTPTGQIAFSFWNNAANRCTYEINVIDVSGCLAGADTCQANRRIFTLNNASEPALSPDGTRLAFRGWGGIPEKHQENRLDHPYFGCSANHAERRLGHTNLDGNDYFATGQFWEDSHPDWSPDGQRLLFDTARNGDDITRIMAIGRDGQVEEDLRIAGQQPSWAPDNDRFVYRGCDLSGNRCGLWLARAFPVQAWDLGINMIGPLLEDSAVSHPDWSPVTNEVLYQSPAAGSWDLYLVDVDGGAPRQITTDASIEGLPTWSPDGQWLAYLSDANGGWGIWLMRKDGTERQRLMAFDGGIFTPQPVTPYFNRDWLDEQISWSR